VKLLGTTGNDFANAVAVDSAGNAYITGFTDGTLDGQTNAGGIDAFLAKYDSSGNKLWVKLLGTSGNDGAFGVAVDASGNAYITGYVGGSLDGQTYAGLGDAFIAKYDSSGNKQWVKLLGTSGSDGAGGVAVDASGNVYIAGNTNGNLDGQTNAGDYDAFIAKYNSFRHQAMGEVAGHNWQRRS
jgi:hypothetical protein